MALFTRGFTCSGMIQDFAWRGASGQDAGVAEAWVWQRFVAWVYPCPMLGTSDQLGALLSPGCGQSRSSRIVSSRCWPFQIDPRTKRPPTRTVGGWLPPWMTTSRTLAPVGSSPWIQGACRGVGAPGPGHLLGRLRSPAGGRCCHRRHAAVEAGPGARVHHPARPQWQRHRSCGGRG